MINEMKTRIEDKLLLREFEAARNMLNAEMKTLNRKQEAMFSSSCLRCFSFLYVDVSIVE